MSSVVIASNYEGSQAVKNYLVTKKRYTQNDIAALTNGDTLVIAGHDVELGDATALLNALPNVDLSNVNFSILLIVCSAHTLNFTKDVVTPAENIANYFNKPVKASKTVVTATIKDDNINLEGDFEMVQPESDLISMFSRLTI